MYTRCPDCSTSFRVTAEVLKQAAGKVRCGGCGNAFNALDYLSESKPEEVTPRAADAPLPELKPEPADSSAGIPTSISAEQSAALLKTLDELAGADIRIEDTGVEWRVLDDDEIGDAASDAIAVDVEVEDQPAIDEILENSPTPVDQFLTDTPPEVDSPEIFAGEDIGPTRTSVDELRFDDNTPLPEDFDLLDDVAEAPAMVAEPEPEPEPVVEEPPQADLDLSEPDEWTDILDEFEALLGDEEPAAEEDQLEADEDEDEDDGVEADDVEAVLLDMDSQFAVQAEAMGIDLSGVNESLDLDDEPPLASTQDLDDLLAEGTKEERDIEELLQEEILDEVDEDEDESTQLELIAEDDEQDSADEDDYEAAIEYVLPPLSEEEQTINMQIDADLMAIAVEDEDGFASTMILEQADIEGKAQDDESPDLVDEDEADEDEADDDDETAVRTDDENDDDEIPHSLMETGGGFETIIMEGSAVSLSDDREKREKDKADAAVALADAAAKREADKAAGKRDINYGMVAGIAILVLVFVLQGLHQARNTLATIPAFNSVVGPVYRALGSPLSPEWDITGWRFEATTQKTAEDDSNLLVYSRIGNKSETPLPYPIINVVLSDRFEEPLGSVSLDPGDYLADDLDPRRLVEPGNTFEAVITVSALPENATSFRLRPCYRAADGQLRCKEDDFR